MLLLSTVTLKGYGIHRIFDFAKKAWYTGLDLSLSKTEYDLWDGDYILELSKKFDLPVLSVTAPSRKMNEKEVDRVVALAQKLDTQIINFTPPHFTDKKTTWYSEYLARIKKNTRLAIAVINVEPKNVFFIIPEHKNASLTEIKKVTGDTTFNIASTDAISGTDAIKAQKILGGSIKNVFFSDKNNNKAGLLPGGAGGWISYLPLESLLMKLKTTGYGGFITIRVHPKALGVGNDERVLQNLEYIKKYTDKHFYNFK